MHVGHLRSTIIGDAIARTLDFAGHPSSARTTSATGAPSSVGSCWRCGTRPSSPAPAARDPRRPRRPAVAARTATCDDKDKVAYATIADGLVREIAPLHQQFIDEDPDGTRYFLPYLGKRARPRRARAGLRLRLAVTDAPEADATSRSRHPQHGRRTLAELPRLTTTFIQNPDLPDNEQEKLAWEKARAITLDACNRIYRRLDVQLADPSVQSEPLERGESFYNPFLPTSSRELKARASPRRAKAPPSSKSPASRAR